MSIHCLLLSGWSWWSESGSGSSEIHGDDGGDDDGNDDGDDDGDDDSDDDDDDDRYAKSASCLPHLAKANNPLPKSEL